jgi:SOS response regulatory protein OraA/RecX
VIAAFVADGTLDDRRAGAAHVRTASRVKGRGRLRIARELEGRGIDRNLAKELASEVSPEAEADGITRVLHRKRVPARMSAEERRKVFQQLLRRGFTADAIADALRKHGKE